MGNSELFQWSEIFFSWFVLGFKQNNNKIEECLSILNITEIDKAWYMWTNLNLLNRASLVSQIVNNLLAIWETWVWSQSREDPWRRTWQPTPAFLPGKSPWTEEPGGLQSMGSQTPGYNRAHTKTKIVYFRIYRLFSSNYILR